MAEQTRLADMARAERNAAVVVDEAVAQRQDWVEAGVAVAAPPMLVVSTMTAPKIPAVLVPPVLDATEQLPEHPNCSGTDVVEWANEVQMMSNAPARVAARFEVSAAAVRATNFCAEAVDENAVALLWHLELLCRNDAKAEEPSFLPWLFLLGYKYSLTVKVQFIRKM